MGAKLIGPFYLFTDVNNETMAVKFGHLIYDYNFQLEKKKELDCVMYFQYLCGEWNVDESISHE